MSVQCSILLRDDGFRIFEGVGHQNHSGAGPNRLPRVRSRCGGRAGALGSGFKSVMGLESTHLGPQTLVLRPRGVFTGSERDFSGGTFSAFGTISPPRADLEVV